MSKTPAGLEDRRAPDGKFGTGRAPADSGTAETRAGALVTELSLGDQVDFEIEANEPLRKRLLADYGDIQSGETLDDEPVTLSQLDMPEWAYGHCGQATYDFREAATANGERSRRWRYEDDDIGFQHEAAIVDIDGTEHVVDWTWNQWAAEGWEMDVGEFDVPLVVSQATYERMVAEVVEEMGGVWGERTASIGFSDGDT